MDDVLVVTTEEIGRTETNVVLYWVDRDTGPGFFSQDSSRSGGESKYSRHDRSNRRDVPHS